MTHPRNTAASPEKRVLSVPDGDLPDRARRAREEPMAVLPFGTDVYAVDTAGGGYLVDLGAGRCDCPDHRFRDVRCKHLRRVAIEVTEGRVPPPGQVAVECRDCEREVFVPAEAADDGPHYCPDHRIAPGDAVRDRETGDRLVVVTPAAGRADRVSIPGHDCTVAEYPTNRRYDPGNPVVGAVYPRARVAETGPRPDELRVYSFPRSRLRRVDPDDGADPDSGPGRDGRRATDRRGAGAARDGEPADRVAGEATAGTAGDATV